MDKLAKKISKEINMRVTFINSKGIVIGESDKDKITMDNHSNRPEIITADFQEYGMSIRESDTLHKKMLYVSKKFNLGSDSYYIRMARDVKKIENEFFHLSIKVGILFLLFIGITVLISMRISKNIQTETEIILRFLDNLKSKKKKIKNIDSTYSYEFQKITRLLNDVANTLNKRAKQKAKYTAKLKLSNRQKDDIISAISHEFKNPIAVINGYSQTLIEDEELNVQIRQKFLSKIISNSNKISEMIDRLRLSLKLEESDYKENYTKVDLRNLVQNIVDDLKISYEGREIIIQDNTDVKIKADETMIRIAIENIVENALKYSQDDVEIKITDKYISVTDHGLGIKEEDIPNITQRFFRVSNNSWNNSLGIGLSLVSNIIKKHKFTLDIESEINEGSKFTIKF
jgi:signal transduction histidine kinase